MKKKVLSILALAIISCVCLFMLTACENGDNSGDTPPAHEHSFTNYISDNNATYDSDGTKTAKCDNCDATDTIIDVGSMLVKEGITFKTLKVSGNTVYGKVSNTTETFSFINEIKVTGRAKFIVALDLYGTQEVKTKTIPLEFGDNKVYVTEYVGDEPIRVYTVTVRRRPMYSVTFNVNGGSAVENQVVEEDSLAQKPNDLVKVGYTFDGWDYDFNTPITKNETVTALWTANDNTPYTVEYYLENLENEEYTLTQTNNLTGVTDTTAYAEIKTFEHFTAEKQTVSGNINGNGTTVLKVYYQRNEYTVSNADKSLGSITGAGKYKYGKQVTLTATPNLGYDFIGWYNGNTLLNSNLECKFTIDKDIIAKFTIKPEMANFNFTSTATTCVISGVKNKTITEITVPNYVTSIGYEAFYNCDSLTSIMVDENNENYKSIDGNLYSKDGKTLIQYAIGKTDTAFTIPNSVTSIGSSAFENCSSLTSVVIGNSVTSIGAEAFSGCYKLVEVINKSSHITVTKSTSNGYLGYYALAVYNSGDTFTGTKLSNDNGYIVYTEGSEKILVAYNGSQTNLTIPNYLTKTNAYAFAGCKSLTSIEIPNSVTSIGDCAFYDCKSLTSIEIPNSVTSIGDSAFRDCNSLTSIEIPDSVTNIGSQAFYDCDSLTSVTIGNGVTSIGDWAFRDCSSLTSIVIPDSVTSIGDYAFEDCSKLTNIKYRGTLSQWKAISKGFSWSGYTGSYTITYNYNGD